MLGVCSRERGSLNTFHKIAVDNPRHGVPVVIDRVLNDAGVFARSVNVRQNDNFHSIIPNPSKLFVMFGVLLAHGSFFGAFFFHL
jgi:hypothetical protein